MKKKEEVVYNLLKLPYDPSFKTLQNVPKKYLMLGIFQPADIQGAVEKVAENYFKGVNKAVSLAKFAENREKLEFRQWLTFKEYQRLYKQYLKFAAMEERADLIIKEENRQEKISRVADKDPFTRVSSLPSWKVANVKRHFQTLEEPTPEAYFKALKQEGVPITQFFNNSFPLYIPEDNRKRHTLVVGQSGSGKSELLKIIAHQYLTNKTASVVIVDPKNDFAEQVAKWKENAVNPGDLVYINPDLDDERNIPVINPFEVKNTSEKTLHILIEELTEAIQHMVEGSTFSHNMEAILRPCVAALLRKEGTSLHDLQRFMDDTQNQDLVEFAINNTPNPVERIFFESKFYDKSYSVTKHAIYSKILSLLGRHGFSKMITGKSTLDLEGLLNSSSKKLIVFNIAKGILGGESSWAFARLLVAMIQGIALRRTKIKQCLRPPTHLILDEFQNFISPRIKEILTESRGLGLHLTLASQVAGQDMDSALKNILMINTNIKIQGAGFQQPHSELDKGEFLINVGNSPMFKFKTLPYLLDDKNQMSEEQWNKVKEFQIKRYYRPPAKEDFYSPPQSWKRSFVKPSKTVQTPNKPQNKTPEKTPNSFSELGKPESDI